MIETFEEMCKRVDDAMRNKKIMPSAYLMVLREYDTWKSNNKPETSNERRNESPNP